ncbi:MAG: 16S rRNA (adenine(1518)-N(6)/adenine(1519)-N(6))-dimethyltransferase RsmA [Bacteroidales bacterium]|nr:16S rRNA (adenine(1518)-N(6)/adenine(1519)-N(6))-dimethyltransferase RsmA [Bacteroidales bacterium]
MVKAKKYLGQHFLTDVSIAARIAGALKNEQNFPVLEIGPGTGILTRELVKRNFSNLTLVEIDTESVEYLRNNFDTTRFCLLEADFLKMDLNAFCDSEMCIVGNFPYNISSQIFFKALENREKVSEIVCMIQKEVAERIASKEGSKVYGILSVLMQLYYRCEYLFTVHEHVFNPPPKVKSGVVRFVRYRTAIEDVDEKKLFMVVKTAFNQRRKTLRNSLKSMLSADTDMTHRFWNLRPEQLVPDEFVELTRMLK